MEKFLDDLNLKPGTFEFVPDLKLGNVVAGVGPHSSRHPQAICNWRKGSKARCTEDNLRTFQGIRKNNEAWLAAGGNKNDVKNFQ